MKNDNFEIKKIFSFLGMVIFLEILVYYYHLIGFELNYIPNLNEYN